MFKIYVIIFILVLPLVLSEACNEGDGCDIACLEGDKDCTCSIQNGYECTLNQNCPGTLLKNYENKICCSQECTETQFKEDTKVVILSNEIPKEQPVIITSKAKKQISIGFLILLLLIMFGFYLKKVLRKFNY